MAIQVRRGNYADFDPDKMLPGEWACVTNGDPGASDEKSVYMCFEAGKVKRMATYDDMKDSINEATQDVQKEFLDGASEDLQKATREAQSAASTATQAASSAQTAAKNAQDAVTSANAAVTSANAAADRANQAADNVKNDFYGARDTFPETGEENKLYIDNTLSPAVLYLFNTELNQYVPINQGSVEFTGSGTTILMQSQQAPKSFRSLKVYGKSTQDGTPSPENPAPIETAGSDGTVDVNLTGANLLNMDGARGGTFNGITCTVNDDGTYSFVGTATGGSINVWFFGSYSNTDALFYLEPGTYTIKDIALYSKMKRLGGLENPVTFTIDKKTAVTGIRAKQATTGSTYNEICYPMLNIGESALPFEPYKGQTLSISTPNGLLGIPVKSGGNYTDETGQQWIADVKDYGTGKYTQNIGQIASYNGEDVGDVWMSSTGQLTTGANVIYQLATPIVTDISAEEMEAEAYKALKTYAPTTVISSDSGVWMEADLVDSDILYPHAENTSYDNSTSGLTSDNVQGAIDENAAAISSLNSSINVQLTGDIPLLRNFAAKSGNIISGAISFTKNEPGWITVGSISEKPSAQFDFCLFNSSSGLSVGILRISQDGSVQAYTLQSTGDMNSSYSYIIMS